MQVGLIFYNEYPFFSATQQLNGSRWRLLFPQVPDLNNYPMFCVKCLEATESLAKKADALHTLVRPLIIKKS